MSDPVITSEDDFWRNEAKIQGLPATIRLKAFEENWPSGQVMPTIIEAILPYYRARTEPASLAAMISQQAFRKQYPAASFVIDPERDPQIAMIVAQQSQTLNAMHGTNYPPPTVMIVDDLEKNTDSPMVFDKDAIMLDRQFYEANRTNPLLAAGIGHELAHRYQRSDALLRIGIKTEVLRSSPNDEELAIVRAVEAEADVYARRMTPKGMMGAFLKDLFAKDAVPFGYYLTSQHGTRAEEAFLNYGNLTPQERADFKRNTDALSTTERGNYFAAGMQIIDDANADKVHPKRKDRLSLQAALDSDESILSCKNILVAENATITKATDCGPKRTPMLLDAKTIDGKIGP